MAIVDRHIGQHCGNYEGRVRISEQWKDNRALDDEPQTPEDACLQGRSVEFQEKTGTIEGMTAGGISVAVGLHPRSYDDEGDELDEERE